MVSASSLCEGPCRKSRARSLLEMFSSETAVPEPGVIKLSGVYKESYKKNPFKRSHNKIAAQSSNDPKIIS